MLDAVRSTNGSTPREADFGVVRRLKVLHGYFDQSGNLLRMTNADLQKFFEENLEQDDSIFGPQCRCAVTLTDGLHLPCVILRKTASTVDLALRRFDEERKGKGVFGRSKKAYRQIVQHFVTSGSTVSSHEVQSVSESPYSLPYDMMKNIHGETMMSWTAWAFEMSDGAVFSYGSSFLFDFFELPDGYQFRDVAKVHNHSYVNDQGAIVSINEDREDYIKKRDANNQSRVFRERPYFTCYIDGGI